MEIAVKPINVGKRIVTSRYFIVSVAAITVIIILVRLLRKIFKSGGLLSSTTEADAERLKQVNREINSIRTEPSRRSKTPEQLSQRADALYQAMYGIGTNEDEVFKALDGLNTEDLIELYKQFGIKEEQWFFVTTFKGDLFGWFTAEFDEADLIKLRDIFARTNIWY